jgi:hypothetical protein
VGGRPRPILLFGVLQVRTIAFDNVENLQHIDGRRRTPGDAQDALHRRLRGLEMMCPTSRF